MRALRVLLGVVGTVMVVAGAAGVVLGVGTVVGASPVNANVDSELRFFAAWYVVSGVLLLKSLFRIEEAGFVVRLVGAGFFLAGCSRLLSVIVVGPPHRLQMVLMGVELVLPLVIVPWQRAVARRSAMTLR